MNLLLTHMKKEKAPRQLPRGLWLLFLVHAALSTSGYVKQLEKTLKVLVYQRVAAFLHYSSLNALNS